MHSLDYVLQLYSSVSQFAVYKIGAFALTALWGFAFGAFPTTANIWMFVHAPESVEKGMPLFVGFFQIMIATGSLFGAISSITLMPIRCYIVWLALFS